MLLLSSVRLRTSWHRVFDPAFTTDQPFYSGNVTYKVRMMNKIDTLKTETFVLGDASYPVTELPYAQRRTAMLFVVPDDLGEIVRTLDLRLLCFWIRTMKKEVCQMVLPKFSVESSLDLKNAMRRLGVPGGLRDRVYVERPVRLEGVTDGQDRSGRTGNGGGERHELRPHPEERHHDDRGEQTVPVPHLSQTHHDRVVRRDVYKG
ncbi:Serp1 [Myxoma virus]|nr:m8.1 [Myxoma virus]AGU99836.1 Serp1 [Myxoma virus]